MVLVGIQQIGHVEAAQDLLAHPAGQRCCLFAVGGQVLEHDHKLIAPEPRHRVFRAHTGLQALRHLLQQQVSHLMPQGVVEGLEVVQVQKQQGPMQTTAGVGHHRLLDTVHQQAPVGQPGQRVVESQVFDLCAGLAQLCHVVVRDHQAAIGRGPLGDLDDTPIGQALLMRPLGVALHCHALLHPALLLFVAGVFQVVPGFLFQQFLERNLGRQLPLEPRINLFKAPVPLHQAKLAVEHHKAADHGFQRLVQRGLRLRNRQTGLGHAVDVAQRDSPHHHDHHHEAQCRQHDAIARGAPLHQRGVQRHAGGNAQVLVHQRAVHHQGLLSAQARTGIPLRPGHIQLGQRRGQHPCQCLFLPRHGQQKLA